MINKIKNENLIKQNKGQIAIIVLLASAIILTLGLSASKVAVTDTKVDTDEESLKEAFNTAESAINNFLINTNNTSYSTEGSSASITSNIIGNADSISSEGVVPANTSQLFWLVDHDADGKIGTNYYQGNSIKVEVDDDFTGALKIDYFYKNDTTYSVTRSGYNFSSTNPIVNNFIDNGNSSKEVIITTNNGDPLLLAITPLGSATSLKISGPADFPSQGEEITAASSTDNGIKTQIKTRYIYQFPSFMLDVITAKGTVE
jgi:hypothetical protein